MKVLNLTQHNATPEQVAAGVTTGELSPEQIGEIRALLTFETCPQESEIWQRARQLAQIAQLAIWREKSALPYAQEWGGEPLHSEANFFEYALIGGAPYLMAPLEAALRARGITPLYAFSVRESVDQVQPDGSVRKVAVFRHVGFVGLDQEIESDEPETLSEEKCARYRDLAASHLTATKDHMNPSFPAQFARLSILYRAANLAADQVQAAAAALPVNSQEHRAEQDRYWIQLSLLNALQIEIDSMLPSVAAEVLTDADSVLADLRFFVGGTLRRQVNQPVDPAEPVRFVDDGPELALLLFLQRYPLTNQAYITPEDNRPLTEAELESCRQRGVIVE